MGMEFYTAPTKYDKRPRVTINKCGGIYLNKATQHQFGFEDDCYVLLGCDKQLGHIGIKRINDDMPRGVRKMVSGLVAARGFLDFFDIPYSRPSFHSPATKDGIMVFNIDETE